MEESKEDLLNTEVDVRLEVLAADNPYIGHTLDFYHDALELHETGGDLEDFLKSARIMDSYSPGQSYHLDAYQIREVLRGIGPKSSTIETDFQTRLAYVLSRNFSQYSTPDKYEEFKKGKNIYTDWESRQTAFKRAKNILGGSLDLDEMFDGTGKGHLTEDNISYIMADFAVKINEPELALHFASEISELSYKSDLFFQANRVSNGASSKVTELFHGLEKELEAEPVELTRFLIRKIKEIPATGNEDIFEATLAVVALISDDLLFEAKSHDEAKSSLVEGLSGSGYINLAKAVRFTPRKDKSELSLTKYRDVLEANFNLDVPLVDNDNNISWLRRRRLKKIGKAALRQIQRNEYQHKARRELGMSPELSKLLMSFDDLDGLRQSLNDSEEADRIFQQILSIKAYSTLIKLKAATLMATSFSEWPASQLDIRARFDSEFERVSNITSKETLPGVVNRSTHRQYCMQEINGLENIAKKINDLSAQKEAMNLIVFLKNQITI